MDATRFLDIFRDAEWPAWLLAGGQLALALLLGWALHGVVFFALGRLARRTSSIFDDVFLRHLRAPSRLFLPALLVQQALPALEGLVDEDAIAALHHALSLVVIAALVWLVTRALGAAEEAIKHRHEIDVQDNLEARRVHTQMGVLRQVLQIFAIVVGIAVALMTFPRVRELGASVLASAGLAGLVVGLSARPVLENVISGLQLAFTQPIRLDDVVIVQGEWGRVEEITTTYVVIRIWDQRRLIVPFSKFISEPFQNWTRSSSEILGTVLLYVDWTVPVEAVREELCRIVEGHEKWDGRACVLQVTDASENTLQLRALVSAADASAAWDLRVHVREKLVEWLQREYPDSLPRRRVELAGERPTEPTTA